MVLRAQNMLPPSYNSLYDILGIDKSASIEDVRRAYKRKALETHPDKLGPTAHEQEKEIAEAQFRKVYEAFEVLGDTEKRRVYDARLYERRWELSEDLKRRRKDREEWALKQEEQRRLRTEAFRTQRQREQLEKTKQLETMAKLVNEMVDELNNEIPGWLERKRQIEQKKAAREMKAKQASRPL
ncbi:DnaJ domain-containing protein [Collybia nuda]|uniref:DnaJ domain-containing protein n=1 Tax=Collybia nuda TaxID=64659 RepID=A0A9P6CEE9_9AGAR|nr:DnaJ domain-containing protein [Collybia nuda]